MASIINPGNANQLKDVAAREPKGSVIEQLYLVEDRVNDVVKKLDDLDVHLTPALSPVSTDCQPDDPAPDTTCELDSRLQTVKIRLENIIYRLTNLNARVQF